MSFCLINRKNFIHNIEQITKRVPISKLALAMKSNAYGHGLKEIAFLANEMGIKHAMVHNLDEAFKIQNLFGTILVLMDIPQIAIPTHFFIAINSLESLPSIPEGTSVELKIDTGMHRNGIMPEDLKNAIRLIERKKLILKGLFTTFSSASEDNDSVFQQKKIFDQIITELSTTGCINKIRFHCANSSALFRFDNNQYDLTRPGIAAYGYIDLPDNIIKPDLKPVLSLWAEKISSRLLKKSESIGYGGVFTADKDMVVSTYDIGYAHGFLRLDEKKESSTADGRPILGRVSMESFSTTGNNKKLCLFDNAEELAHLHKTIVYEILVRISPFIRRIII